MSFRSRQPHLAGEALLSPSPRLTLWEERRCCRPRLTSREEPHRRRRGSPRGSSFFVPDLACRMRSSVAALHLEQGLPPHGS
uniref:Uncharacterized protein n=1 Tax=Leersia perrieri TaxID=77586 RepID=A0A0D9XTC0_9ORYZ